MTGTQKFVLGLAGLFVVLCLGCMGCATLGSLASKGPPAVDAFCRTRNGLHKAKAAVEFGKAALQFRDTATRFYSLVAAKGIEALVQ